MTENEWTKSICEKLNMTIGDLGMTADTLVKIPYSQEISNYEIDWGPGDMDTTLFETDLVVYEEIHGRINPRVIVEAKLGNVTTHDAITYSYKANKHKNITPYLRYGIMIGNRGGYSLPGRLFRHGENFDFMFSFKGEKPDEEEWKTFIEMIKMEIEYSRVMEEALHNSRNKNRKKYYMLQKQLFLKEF